MSGSELATLMRAVVFAGHNVQFTPTQAVRHKFGIRLIRALKAPLSISEPCALHAMLVWTISMSTSARGGNLEVCVACLIVCAKMHETCAIGLRRYATACRQMFQSRDQIRHAIELTLQQEADTREQKMHYLTSVLRMFDFVDLASEVAQLTVPHLKHAEVFLLFTSLHGRWFRYLIELDEYVRSKTQGMSSKESLQIILEVCYAQDT